MNPDFGALEHLWITAVQRQDKPLLDELLDDTFVCTAWSSAGDLTTRDEYLANVESVEFGCCNLEVDDIQLLGECAVVRCRLHCDCFFGQRSWKASFLITDVWIRRGSQWKAVSRHASVPLGDWPALLDKFPRAERRMRSRAESA